METNKILKGAPLAAEIKENLIAEASAMEKKPMLATVRIGEKPDSIAYERNAVRRMKAYGMDAKSYVFPESITTEDFVREFKAISDDDAIDGILLMRPFPEHISEEEVYGTIDPMKDLDGISPINVARVFSWDARGYAAAIVEAIVRLLLHAGIELKGKNVTIVGRSKVVGRALAMMLLQHDATVTICHTKTIDMDRRCREADILVTCAGQKDLITAEYVKKDAVVIDVGFNVDEDGNISGDADFEGILDKVKMITPVPGGVGGVTTAILAEHLLRAAKSRRK
ncbi:methylenetetrahydrofolate dehydrogenase (NADP+) / methenyltetrahydrofolate cyclohydrolase [[Clostridium] aminophilum]|uniref:Bifunctional protein FolD n=1 Tax=[Clostridium] aminophilum TaxID=1526 RepID=A0A1I0H6D9_9FIRM|nr:bifunctional 5,10-methylenetetrahydrofolate dehydrogenase/5,10-methenyltetrahydrofolate cyclohydrolase [[Clostridium] aminophilum]SET78324.1 methylenetetrahydrofolate dehydrogenase (NADP+) / methenyltetrahydrofolate cyclohydrolase [[Clostridium] aminophilum]